MKEVISRVAIALGISLAGGVAITAVGSVVSDPSASAAMAVCRDSNGSRPGGSVYAVYGRPIGCDVVRPVRLHEVRVPSKAACDDAGGHGWTATVRICWDRDY